VFVSLFFYCYVAIYEPQVDWGRAFHSRKIYKTYRSLLDLALTANEDELYWRPSFLVITFGKEYSLTKFVETLRKMHSFIFSVSIIKENYRKAVMRKLDERYSYQQLKQRHGSSAKADIAAKDKSYVSIKDGYLPIRKFQHKNMKFKGKRSLGFNDIITTDGTYRHCMQTVLQNCGLGALRPNTLILNCLRLDDVFDFTPGDDEEVEQAQNEEPHRKHSDRDEEDEHKRQQQQDEVIGDKDIDCSEYVEILRDSLLYGYGVMVCHGLCDLEKYRKIDWNLQGCFENVIDVWWIADDGGLILLIPYVMCRCTYWKKCKVRINLIKDESMKIAEEHEMDRNVNGNDMDNENNNHGAYDHQDDPEEINKIQALINKFRLNKVYQDEPRIIRVKNNNPSKHTIRRFEKLSGTKIKTSSRQNVLLRWLRLSELLNEYSKQSLINVVTLPVPTSHMKPKQYVAILNMLSDQNTLPPTIIMRGNGEQTLTFYSE